MIDLAQIVRPLRSVAYIVLCLRPQREQYGVSSSSSLYGSNSSCGKLPGAYPIGNEYILSGNLRERRCVVAGRGGGGGGSCDDCALCDGLTSVDGYGVDLDDVDGAYVDVAL